QMSAIQNDLEGMGVPVYNMDLRRGLGEFDMDALLGLSDKVSAGYRDRWEAAGDLASKIDDALDIKQDFDIYDAPGENGSEIPMPGGNYATAVATAVVVAGNLLLAAFNPGKDGFVLYTFSASQLPGEVGKLFQPSPDGFSAAATLPVYLGVSIGLKDFTLRSAAPSWTASASASRSSSAS